MGLPVENDLKAITLIASAQIIELNQNLAPKRNSSSSIIFKYKQKGSCDVVTIILKFLNNGEIGSGFKKRNQAITFFSFMLNISKASSLLE